jgi:hypothetical protein
MSDDARLERIEKKVDQMGEGIVAMARMEERMITLFKRMDTLDLEQAHQGRRLTIIENKVGSNGQMLRFAERVFWIIITAAVAYAFTQMQGK